MPTTKEIRAHYDSLALVYRAFWGDHIHHGLFDDNESPALAQVRLIEHCLQLLPGTPRQMLDVGCGHGGTAACVAERFNCHVIAMTISEKQARLARQKVTRAGLQDRISVLTADAESFAFPRERFDLVWTMESSEHFSDKRKYFENVERTLCPGGQLLVAAWAGSMNSPAVRRVARAFLCPELWTARQYAAAMETAGMKLRVSEDLTRRVARTWEICRERAKSAGFAVRLLPAAAREFVAGIDLMVEAYRSGELRYTVMLAEKPD